MRTQKKGKQMKNSIIFRCCTLLLSVFLLLSLSSCTPSGENEETDPPEVTTAPEPEITRPSALPTALELLKESERIADGYASAIQTISNKMKIGDNMSTEQITVNIKSGDNNSVSIETDGVISKAMRLENATLYYYDETYGALELSGASEEIFEELRDSDGNSEMFDYSDSECYENGEVEKTADGYNVKIGFSELGKKKLVESMNLGEEADIKFTKLDLTAKINADGSSDEQKISMELELRISGVTMTMTADAEMKFTKVNEAVELGGLVEGGYMKFGSCEHFKKLRSANDSMNALYTATLPFSFERMFEMSFNSSSASPVSKVVYVNGAFDPAKGINYLIEHKNEGKTYSYYSDFNQVVFDEHNGKVHVDPGISTDALMSSLFNDLAATNLGTVYCDSVLDIKDDRGIIDYRFAIDGEIAIMLGNAYVQNNLGVTPEEVSSPGAFYTVRVNEDGRISNISIDLTFVFTLGGINYYGSIYDTVGGISYDTPAITPLIPVS